GKTPAQQAEFAVAALDLAYGRGGDQAVIKKINKIEYYGGKSQVVEKRNKGKSRIMAHALRQLIDQSSNVIIMGHKYPDMDCFGAALGIYRMALNRNKEVSIILEEVNDGIDILYDIVKSTNNYNFITNDTALALVEKDTLLVVVDTYRPSFTQCPEVLNLSDKIVVIDHHRKMEEYIDNAVLSYMEPYASSASELVTEILQYMGDKKEIEKIEAEALLAGITVDTKNFSFKTGVRTFEAASWLRRIGADTTNVKQLFQSDMDNFIAKAEIIRNAQKVTKTTALSVSDIQYQSANIIIAQAADELLEIKGITTSFVIGLNSKGEVIVSARSLGDINVQVIMEKMGGGGHLTMAGMQSNAPIEQVERQLIEIIQEYVKEGDDT
ncbi:MAG: DHH family phosphoesterase, partial [Clostridia bacterium]|nr:DHH family phosphoesterase [Clostridia bacterium]